MNKKNLNKNFISLLPSVFVLLAIATLSSNVHSIESHPLDDITKTAQDFVLNDIPTENEDIQVVIGQLDSRLKLHQCTVPLEAYKHNYTMRQGRGTVGVRCNDLKPWSLYVPVSVKHYKKVATLKRALMRNSILTDEHISMQKMNINRLSSGYFDDLAQLKGKILTQNLSKGTVLTQHHIKLAIAIQRGQRVTVIAKSSAVEVRMEGTAMSKGAIGQRIKVKNIKTRRIVEGVIINKHLISVNL